MSAQAEIALELRNDVAEIARLSEAVESFCNAHHLPDQVAFHINLVLEEAVVNVIHYAFADAGPHPIHVSLWLAGTRVGGEVRDDGRAFDPLQQAAPRLDLDLDHRAAGGLGVHFLKTLMDEVVYTRNNGQNCLRFVKNMTAGDTDPGQPV